MNKNAIQTKIWTCLAPRLGEAGFQVAGNAARRFSASQIEVIGLQWFSAAAAKRLGCPPYSFAVRLGCYFRFIPSNAPVEVTDGQPLPEEAHCHIRKTLLKNFKQPECEEKDVWFIDTAGSYLEEAGSHLGSALSQDALPWFGRFADLNEVLRTLREDAEDESKAFGFGRTQSPMRHLYTGFVALEIGDKRMAAIDLRKALAAGCFGSLQSQIESAIALTA